MSFCPSRTVSLTERTPRACRLAPSDLEYLLAHHRGHLDLSPTGRRHVYRVTPLGHVGVIVAPGCRLVIRAKIPLRSLFYLLDPALPLPSAPDRETPAEGTEAFDILAGQFAQLLAEKVGAGLHRDYVERSEQSPYLHGRLDVPAQVRESPARKEHLHSCYDDLTVDVPCNQVLRATAEQVLSSGLPGAEVCAWLRQALSGFDGVLSTALDLSTFDRLAPERLPEGYRPLLNLGRLLAEGLMPSSSAGSMTAPAFLIDLERAFERHLTRGVVAAFAGRRCWSVAVQPRCIANRQVAGQPDLSLRPDLILEREGRPVMVVDAKWKRLPQDSLMTDDVYQVLTYATALGAKGAVLVYPGGRARLWDYTLSDSPIRLVVRTLGVSGTRERCERALRKMGRWLRKYASASGGC
jgi:5-methylcytosine-specific restriction enzyme subunit McrC